MAIEAGRFPTIEATNVALAGAALDALGARAVWTPAGAPVGAALLDAGALARAKLVGRMERFAFGPRGLPVILDGAHVPFNIAAVLSDLAREPALAGPCIALVALARDKDATGFLTEIGRRASRIVLTGAPGAIHGRPAAELCAIAVSLGLAAEAEPDPVHAFRRAAALAQAAGQWLIVTGSLYLVGALRGEARGGG